MQTKTGIAEMVVGYFQIIFAVIEKSGRIVNRFGFAVNNLVNRNRNLKQGTQMEKLYFKR